MKFLPLLGATLLGNALGLTCEQGKVPDMNQMCIKPRYIEGCTQYANPSACNICDFNYKLNSNGICEYEVNNSSDCCLKRDGLSRCIECNRGLYLNDNYQCREIKILGCLEGDIRGKCINCASGNVCNNGLDFVLTSDGKCQKGIKDCLQYLDDSRKICIECRPNQSLINNVCLINKILGCKKEVDHSCKECYKPFSLKEGHCEIADCKTYNDFGCTGCQCGFFITQGRTCQQVAPGCLRYQRGSCTDCLPHFKLKGNSCDMDGCKTMKGTRCAECKQNYRLKDGFCVMTNCESWANDRCNVCSNGYFHKDGECVKGQDLPQLTTNLIR